MATRMQPAGLDLVDDSAPDSQRVAVLEAPYRITTARARIPEPGDDEVRVKVRWVGVCGSDVEVYRGTRRPEWLSLPARLGHEVAGVIDKLGAHVRGLAAGDQVICRYIWGGFAEYVVCRPFNVKKLPPGFPLKEASLIEILPGILHAAELSRIDPGTDVLIMGQGVSGLTLTQVISLYSPRSLAVTDLKERNLELARRYGATHAYRLPTPQTPTMEVAGEDFPAGFDVVIPCMTVGHGMIDAVGRRRGLRPHRHVRLHRDLRPAVRLLQGPLQAPDHPHHGAAARHRHAALLSGGRAARDGRPGEHGRDPHARGAAEPHRPGPVTA